MIYLIGGPPKCGKTTLAKRISKKFGIPWVSTDSLENVIKPYLAKKDFAKNFPSSAIRGKSNDEKYSKYSSKQIISAYKKQAKTVSQAIEMFALCEMTDGNDLILEGYHIEPSLAAKLQEKYGSKNIRSVYLVKTDPTKFVQDIKKTSTPNDWIINRTKNKKTYVKISKMICDYSKYFMKEAGKYRLKVFNTDYNFDQQITKIISKIF